MAILGGGGQSVDDPVYVDTLESLKEALADEVKLYKYIAFPEVYDAPKVIDLRSAGWNPINIQSPPYKSERPQVHIHFNNWTVLGLSMMDSMSPLKTFFNVYEVEVYIYDLTIKNAYILAATSDASMITCAEGNNTAIISFYRCKFSMCIDAQNSDVIAFDGFVNGGYHTNRCMNFYQCSFNVNYVMGNTGSHSTLYHQNYSEGSFVNCIFNIVASHHRCSTSSNKLIGYCRQLQFCKIVGSIEHVSGDIIHILECSSDGGSVYNVIDMNITDYVTRDTTLYVQFKTGKNIINSSKLSKANGSFNKQYSNLTECTTAQMQDKDYLNSIEFICGDTPT